MIHIRSLTKTFVLGSEIIYALDKVDAIIPEGSFVVITGPSGSGKSTFLHLIGGIDVPDEGEIIVDGMALQTLSEAQRTIYRRRYVGFIFQAFHLIPYLTVYNNIALPAFLDGREEAQIKRRINELMEWLGLDDVERRLPYQLSGGQQQRVAIARALVNDPQLILADEPTGNLDSETGEQVMALLRDINEKGKTVLLATHNPDNVHLGNMHIRLKDGKVQEGERTK